MPTINAQPFKPVEVFNDEKRTGKKSRPHRVIFKNPNPELLTLEMLTRRVHYELGPAVKIVMIDLPRNERNLQVIDGTSIDIILVWYTDD